MSIHHQLVPGQVPLAVWRDIYFGAGCSLAPGAEPAVQAAAETVAAIIAKGEPVYGINTGFGKLASVRIEDHDLAVLQRNIVLSHAAGVGEPLPAPVVRLIMALKIASLAQGFSGVRWQTITQSCDMPREGADPGHSRPGLGRRLRRSGAARPYERHLAGCWFIPASMEPRFRPPRRWPDAGLAPLELGPKEGLALLNGTQVSTALALAGLFEGERVFRAALVTGALSTDAARGSDGPFDPRIHAVRATAARPRSPRLCAA